MAAIIIYWNTLKLGDAVFARGQAGLEIPDELLAHVSPLGWEHINLTGEYRWPGADRRGTAKSSVVFRPLPQTTRIGGRGGQREAPPPPCYPALHRRRGMFTVTKQLMLFAALLLCAPVVQAQPTPQQETAFWQSIADGTNPAEFEAYLAQFPNGVFRALAELRLAALRGAADDPPPAPASSTGAPTVSVPETAVILSPAEFPWDICGYIDHWPFVIVLDGPAVCVASVRCRSLIGEPVRDLVHPVACAATAEGCPAPRDCARSAFDRVSWPASDAGTVYDDDTGRPIPTPDLPPLRVPSIR